jgi:hypothetical protein
MTTLYILHHRDQETYDANDEDKVIGVYSSEARAQQAIERLRDKPGFRDFPERWFIGELTLDKDSTAWNEGFITVYRGDDYNGRRLYEGRQ